MTLYDDVLMYPHFHQCVCGFHPINVILVRVTQYLTGKKCFRRLFWRSVGCPSTAVSCHQLGSINKLNTATEQGVARTSDPEAVKKMTPKGIPLPWTCHVPTHLDAHFGPGRGYGRRITPLSCRPIHQTMRRRRISKNDKKQNTCLRLFTAKRMATANSLDLQSNMAATRESGLEPPK